MVANQNSTAWSGRGWARWGILESTDFTNTAQGYPDARILIWLSCVMWYLVPRNILSPPDQIFQESWNIWSGETEYFRYSLKYLVPHRNIWSPPISNHWRWYRQVLKVMELNSSSSALDTRSRSPPLTPPLDSFDIYCICRMPEMVESKKWGECIKCLRWYHTNKCLNKNL